MLLFNTQALGLVIYGTTKVYTDPSLSPILGAAEKILLQATVTQASASSTLKLDVEHSNDGSNWILVGSTFSQALTTGTLASYMFTASGPFAAFVRVAAYMVGSDTCNLTLNIAGRAELQMARRPIAVQPMLPIGPSAAPHLNMPWSG